MLEDAKIISDNLLIKHDIYIQPINYPTITKGSRKGLELLLIIT